MADLIPGDGTMLALTTIGSAEAAQKLADALVHERLVACCNLLEVRSTFVWKDALCNEPEIMMVMKTRRELLETLMIRVRQLHPYDCPELITVPVESGYAAYLHWVRESTATPDTTPDSTPDTPGNGGQA